MANTYTQVHIHYIFAPKYRDAVLDKSWRPQLFSYMTGIVQNYGHKMLQINGMPDHVHMLVGMRPTQAMSDLMKQVKEDSSKWIKANKFVRSRFNWQEGFGAFSYSKSQVPQVIQYIQDQEIHHAKKTFLEEYKEFLDKFEVGYDERYIFKPLE
ncbi:MAG: IS200/IS605 family transposase [Saprospiraceae bacterium]|nr:IS200/IS605 family transposase [Saprospiraceae bacterium]